MRSSIFLVAATAVSVAFAVNVGSPRAASGVRLTLETPLRSHVARGKPMAIRMKLWRPARAGVCYQPDPIHRPGTCTRPKPGVPLPLCCLKPIVIITNASSDATEMLPALPVKPHALDGRYRATVVFAESGSWSIEVNDRHGGIHNLGQVKVGP